MDDNAAFLVAARGLLERQGITVTGVASSAAEGIARAAELKPQVILIDIDLGCDNGFALARDLAQAAHNTPAKLILVSTHPEEDFADLIAESPAIGFIAKSQLSGHAIRQLLGDCRSAP